jgi:hypothetical protein
MIEKRDLGEMVFRIGDEVIPVKDVTMTMEVEEELRRVPRQYSFSIETATWHRPIVNTPKLDRHFKEVRVPWDVSKAKKKLKRG